MTSRTGSSQARLVGIFVLVLIISLAEFAALILDYQNNRYLRQYVSDNLGTIILAAIGLLIVAGGAGYVVSKRLGVPMSPGPRVPTFARIGSFVGRRYKLIIVFWILLFAASFPLSQQLSQVTTSNTSGGQSSSSQSALAQNLMAQEFPHPQSNASAIILLQGNDVTDNATKIFTLRLERNLLAPGVLNSLENVTTIYSLERTALTLYYLQNYSYPVAQSKANQTVWHETLSQYPPLIPPTIIQNFVSPNKNAMIILVTFSQAPGSFGSAVSDPILKNVVTLRNIISQLKASNSQPLQTYVTGDLATTADSSLGSTADLSRIEPVTIGAILILTGLFFLAIVTPFVPLATVGMALLMAEGGLYLIGKYIIPIQDTTTTFLFTIMLGVGTDYAIFLMARYREERVEGRDKAEAVQTSITWSGESIATSATTVIIAFGAMTLTSFTLLRSIGVGLGFVLLILLLVSLTLIPSLILVASAQTSLEKLSQNITRLSNVKEVTGPTRPNGIPVNATNMASLTPEERQTILGSIGKDYRTAMLTILFAEEPFTQNSLNTVTQIRRLITSLQSSDPSLAQDTILVGGASASTLDFANETVNQFNTIRVLTVAAIFVVLLVVLGSYPLAITGILSIGLSIIWAYAATLLFFNNVLRSGVLFIIPLVLFLLLYGIGMDYNIFILTRIREEAQKGQDTVQAVVDAVDRTGGIITALALILAGALGSLLLSSNRLLQGFGFAIGLAVILDAMVVRTYLVPAGMSLL